MDLPQAESLYSLQRKIDNYGGEGYPTYIDLRDRNRSFDGLAAYTITTAGLDTGDNPSRVWVETVSGNFFDVLRIKPHLGRFFHALRRARAEQRALCRALVRLLALPLQ